MATFLIVFLAFLLAVGGLAIGVALTGRRISGSCGGLGAVTGDDKCAVCGASYDPETRRRLGRCAG